MRKLRVALIAAALSACVVAHRETSLSGTLLLTIHDSETGDAIPARVAIRDSNGKYFVPAAALAVFADCTTPPLHNWLPAAAKFQARREERRSVRNGSRGSTEFYTAGALSAPLPPGRYQIRVEKGPEYRIAAQEFFIKAGGQQPVRINLGRWINLPAQGWHGADDHLHIPRSSPDLDPVLAAWMQAEGIHVANLLQMGMARDVHLTPQWAFGEASVYTARGTLLAGAQENPRTHVFGHSIVLGAERWIDFPAAYLRYDLSWEEAHRQGALAGYAHFGMAAAQDGLALWGRRRLIDFIEVLNVGFPYYGSWYDALNLGERVTPTAGTDYPCVANLPGRERFYTKVDGSLTFRRWLDAVRRGRTFVTNGPVVELSAGASAVGDELRLAKPGALRVSARVRFDTARDRVDRIEIVQAGHVVATGSRPTGVGEITIEADIPIAASTWLAARVSGEKVDEAPADSVDGFVAYIQRMGRKADSGIKEALEAAARPRQPRESVAHTAALYITVAGSPPIGEQDGARRVAQTRLDLLDDLAVRLDDAHWTAMVRFPGFGDGVTRRDIERSRTDLLRAIDVEREHYRRVLRLARK